MRQLLDVSGYEDAAPLAAGLKEGLQLLLGSGKVARRKTVPQGIEQFLEGILLG